MEIVVINKIVLKPNIAEVVKINNNFHGFPRIQSGTAIDCSFSNDGFRFNDLDERNANQILFMLPVAIA